MQPAFTLSPTSLAYGSVLLGTSTTQNITVTAGRKAAAFQTGTVSPFTDTRAGTCHATYLGRGLSIPAGTSCTIEIRFAPDLVTPFSSRVQVTPCKAGINLGGVTCQRADLANAQFVDVAGQGVAPDLDVAGINLGDGGQTQCGYSVVVRNRGNAVADLTNVGVQGYFEPTATYNSTTGTPAGGTTFTSGTTLDPGTTTPIHVGCTGGGAVGDKFLVVRIDTTNALVEGDETNNDFSQGLVDFEVGAIAITGADGTNLFAHSVTVKNIGGGAYDPAALSFVKTYFSSDALLDSNDRSTDCQRVLQSAIAAGGQTDVAMPCNSTPRAGDNYLIAAIDPTATQYEAREGNNTFAVSLPGSDLVMFAVTNLQFNGTTTSYEAQVIVNGDVAIAGSTVLVSGVWSSDATFGNPDDNPACNSLMPAGQYSDGDPVVFTISCANNGPGSANRLIVKVDVGSPEAVAETDESNNVFAAFLPA